MKTQLHHITFLVHTASISMKFKFFLTKIICQTGLEIIKCEFTQENINNSNNICLSGYSTKLHLVEFLIINWLLLLNFIRLV